MASRFGSVTRRGEKESRLRLLLLHRERRVPVAMGCCGPVGVAGTRWSLLTSRESHASIVPGSCDEEADERGNEDLVEQMRSLHRMIARV